MRTWSCGSSYDAQAQGMSLRRLVVHRVVYASTLSNVIHALAKQSISSSCCRQLRLLLIVSHNPIDFGDGYDSEAMRAPSASTPKCQLGALESHGQNHQGGAHPG